MVTFLSLKFVTNQHFQFKSRAINTHQAKCIVIREQMNSSILFTMLISLAVFSAAEYRTNYGAENYTRLIDEFSIVALAQQNRQTGLSFNYPGSGVSIRH